MRDSEQTHVWRLPVEGCASNDWSEFQRRLAQLITRRGLQTTELGQPGGQPLWLLRGQHSVGPALLIAAGFHGEEPAGPWGLLRFLDSAPDALFAQAQLAFLPLVNVTGFMAGRRYNDSGENPNRGFCAEIDDEAPSQEGQVLQAHAELLTTLARDGALSCHEDVLVREGYVYAFERRASPGPFTLGLRDTNARFFDLLPDGQVDDCPVQDGIVFNHRDGSFEAWLYACGVTRAACTETPGLQDMETRIAANAAMMQCFVEYALHAHHPTS